MAHRDNTYDTTARTPAPAARERPAGRAGIVDYLGLLGLALVAILLVGLVANFLFGPSVSTAL